MMSPRYDEPEVRVTDDHDEPEVRVTDDHDEPEVRETVEHDEPEEGPGEPQVKAAKSSLGVT